MQRNVCEPLNGIVQVTCSIGAGGLRVSIQPGRGDEMGDVLRSLRQMTQQNAALGEQSAAAIAAQTRWP